MACYQLRVVQTIMVKEKLKELLIIFWILISNSVVANGDRVKLSQNNEIDECVVIDCDKNGIVHVAWRGRIDANDNNNWGIYYTNNSEGDYKTPIEVSNIKGYKNDVSLAVTNSGIVHISYSSKFKLYYTSGTYSDGFSESVTISAINSRSLGKKEEYDFRNIEYLSDASSIRTANSSQVTDINFLSNIAYSPDSTIHIIWSRQGFLMYYKKDLSNNEDEVINLSDLTDDILAWNSSLAVDNKGITHFVWEASTPDYAPELYYTNNDTTGAAVKNPTGIWQKHFGIQNAENPSIVIDKNNNIHISCYSSDDNVLSGLYYIKKNYNEIFSIPVQLSQHNKYEIISGGPDLTVGPNNTIYVFYETGTPDIADLYVSKIVDNQLFNPTHIVDSGQQAQTGRTINFNKAESKIVMSYNSSRLSVLSETYIYSFQVEEDSINCTPVLFTDLPDTAITLSDTLKLDLSYFDPESDDLSVEVVGDSQIVDIFNLKDRYFIVPKCNYNTKIKISVLLNDGLNETEKSFYLTIIDNTTGIDEITIRPIKYVLRQNYPNPFNPSTTIKFSITEPGFVKLTIYNSIGEKISTLVNQEKNAGEYSIVFEGNDLPSGVYFYTLQISLSRETKKMLLMQ